jgi:glyoxylate/hydroxypyruvate reductase A
MTLLYKSEATRGREWRRLLADKAPDLPFRMWPDVGDPADVRYLAGWIIDAALVRSLPNLEIVFSTGAGVDQIDLTAIPPGIPLVRMIEPGIAASMVEYVVMSVLALHRNLIDYIGQQRQGTWTQIQVQPASRRRVGVLGLGMLGEAAARKLAEFGFPVAGWSRSPRDLPGIACYSGRAALGEFLARTDILVSLLPLTDETRGLLNADLFAALPAGAAVLSCGRGAQLVQEDLLAALDSGHLGSAVLDVTTPEPLPPDSPLWSHPKVLVTPHIATMTYPETAVEAVIDNIRRHRAGEPLQGLVDRQRGY